MEHKRNIKLLISLIILVLSTVSVFFVFSSDDSISVDKNLFKVQDFTAIDKVILKSKSEQIELKFEGTRWKVNGQLADRNMIDVLFATLQQAEPKRPVAESLQDSVRNMVSSEGVRVSLYAGDEIRKEFLAGGNPSKTQAYFKSKDADEVYLMVIPGYRVYASGIFELDENGWKDKYVFSFNWRNFQSLKSGFPANSKNDFEIAMGKTYYEVKEISAADTTKLNDYLDAVSLLKVDQYVKKESIDRFDSLMITKPVLDLQVSDVSGKIYSLSVFEFGSKTSVLGLIHGTQPAFIDRRKLAGILKNKNWFQKN